MAAIENPALHHTCTRFQSIPVIDLQPFLNGDAQQRRAVASEIGAACRDVGFFYIKNHGIDQRLIDETFIQAKRFFTLPAQTKSEIAIEKSPHHRGYFAIGGENLDPAKQRHDGDYKEGIKIGRDLPSDHPLVIAQTPLHGPNQWPKDLPGWQDSMQTYYDTCQQLGLQLMHAFALALELPENFFDEFLQYPMATLGPLHYPPKPNNRHESQLGAGAHTDFGCLTILAQDNTGGLQVKNSAGMWIDAPPIDGTFVVNIGDMMARWTNDLFASTMHRVISHPNKHRYSIPFFYDPEFDTPVVCLDTCQNPSNPPKYPATTGGRYLIDRINATFDYRENRP